MLIPIGDDNPRDKVPYVNYSLIAINVIVYIYFAWIHGNYRDIINEFGYTPAQFSFLTLFTSLFLHGSIFHLAGNMLYLWIFGDNVEAKFGRIRYLLFYLASGVTAHGLQTAFSVNTQIPNIGASGAIAGVLGAYFVLFPKAKIIFWYFYLIMFVPYSGKFRIPAWVMLGAWLLIQLLLGYYGLSYASMRQGGIAYFAHIGGFFLGMGVMLLFREMYRFQRTRLLRPIIADVTRASVRFDAEQRKGIRNYQKLIKQTLAHEGTVEAVPIYQQMQLEFPGSTVDAESLFKIADSYSRRKMYEQELATYQEILVNYPHSDLADNAVWCMAELYRSQYHDSEKADQCLQIIIDGYPLSEWYNPAKFTLEQQGKEVITKQYLQTVSKLGFFGKQIQFTGPVFVGLIVSFGTMSWMSSTLPHKPEDFISTLRSVIPVFPSVIPVKAGIHAAQTPVWSDNFDSSGYQQWSVKFPKDKLVALDSVNYASQPYSLRFSREKEATGEVHPAEIVSPAIPLDFLQPYTLSFTMFYQGAYLTQKVEYGNIGLEMMLIRMPVVGGVSRILYRFGEENDLHAIKSKKPLSNVFPANAWNQVEISVQPNQKTMTVRINGKEWTTVALSLRGKINPNIRLSNFLTQDSKNAAERTIVYFDNITVYGTGTNPILPVAKPIEIPKVGVEHFQPVQTEVKKETTPSAISAPAVPTITTATTFIEVYQLGWDKYRAGDYGSAASTFQQAALLNPRSPDVHNALGLAYRQTGNEEQAMTEFKQALEINQNYLPAKQNLENAN